MKKFIFGLMLLVSMLGIVGCANPSNSDGSENNTENVFYRVKNGTDSKTMTISYKNNSGNYENNEETILPYGIYEMPANDTKVITVTESGLGGKKTVPVIYLKIKFDDTTTVEGYIDADLEKVVEIRGIDKHENGRFTDVIINNAN